jgi:histidyl-tRNA synthetase
MERRRALEARLRPVFEAHAFREVQTPTFENLELFTAKSGPTIVNELYAFKDKSGRDLALRPEVTAPVMRLYFERLKMEPKPQRVYYVANCFRYDRPQSGRYREFWQMGCELIGDTSEAAMADLLALAAGLLAASGLKEYTLRVGHLGILRAALDAVDVPQDKRAEVMRLIDKRDTAGLEAALPDDRAPLDALFEVDTIEALRAADVGDAGEAVEELARVFGYMEALGVDAGRVRVDAAISRGLDYYSGLVFELDAPRLGAEKQLLGGGAYDLADVFDEKPVPTAGFALGFDRLLLALEAEKAAAEPTRRLDAYAVAFSERGRPLVLAAAAALRAAGARVEIDPQVRPPGKAFKRAAQSGARLAVVAGDQEAEGGVVGVKDLDTQDQVNLAPPDAAAHWVQAVGAGGTKPATPRQG